MTSKGFLPAVRVRGGVAKYDGIIGKTLLAVSEGENELTLVFADNRYLFVRVNNNRLETESVPE